MAEELTIEQPEVQQQEFTGDPPADKTRALFKQVEETGQFDIANTSEFQSIEEKYGFVSGSCTHKQRLHAMREVFNDYQQIIDPHTADGVYTAFKYLEKDVPMVVLETAQAAKFNETVREALGVDAPRPDAYVGIEKHPQRVIEMPADVNAIKKMISEKFN